MSDVSLPLLAIWTIATVFAIAGVLNIAGPRWLRRIYADWDFPSHFYLFAGALQIAAATCLAVPELRIWGIVLTALMLFGSVIMLLNHRRYLTAVAAMLLLWALVPAAFAVPHENHHVQYTDTLLAG